MIREFIEVPHRFKNDFCLDVEHSRHRDNWRVDNCVICGKYRKVLLRHCFICKKHFISWRPKLMPAGSHYSSVYYVPTHDIMPGQLSKHFILGEYCYDCTPGKLIYRVPDRDRLKERKAPSLADVLARAREAGRL